LEATYLHNSKANIILQCTVTVSGYTKLSIYYFPYSTATDYFFYQQIIKLKQIGVAVEKKIATAHINSPPYISFKLTL